MLACIKLLLFSLAVALVVTPPLATLMPHVRSIAAQVSRRHPAIERGSLRPKHVGTAFIGVPVNIASRARTVSRALAVHSQLNKPMKKPHHHLATAAVAARPVLSHEVFTNMLAWSKAVGRAKRVWADLHAEEHPPLSAGQWSLAFSGFVVSLSACGW